jgi:ribosomal protein S18 acetylase RimI-like enzyme
MTGPPIADPPIIGPPVLGQPAMELPVQSVERNGELTDDELQELCEAADAAVIDGGGFGWVQPPGRQALERYFRGVLLVPERELFVARYNGRVVGSAQLVRPPRNNEAQAFAAHLMHSFIAPYARGHGLARLLTGRVEEGARALGYHVLNLDVRDTQDAAIALYESMGYIRWGIHPAYARVGGKTVRGIHYYKFLQPTSRIG